MVVRPEDDYATDEQAKRMKLDRGGDEAKPTIEKNDDVTTAKSEDAETDEGSTVSPIASDATSPKEVVSPKTLEPTKIRIGGVPEHFNSPFHMAIADGEFVENGVDVEWTDYPGGTGAMAKALADDEIDVAILLTEGIFKSIVKDKLKAKIAGVYVQSPLCWGVHTSAKEHHDGLKSLDDLNANTRFAISRLTSGSHLMAFVLAQNQLEKGKPIVENYADLKFEIIKNLVGAKEALPANTADAFLWEKFTTKPIVDEGTFKLIGEVMTPWPCFSIAVSDKFLAENGEEEIVKKLLPTLKKYTDIFHANKSDASVAYVVDKCGLKEADVKEWLKGGNPVEWGCTPTYSKAVLSKVGSTLKSLDVLSQEDLDSVEFEKDVLASFCKLRE